MNLFSLLWCDWRQKHRLRQIKTILVMMIAALFLSAPMRVSAAPITEQQEQIDLARITVDSMRRNVKSGPVIERWLAQAKAVLIFPNLFRAGLFVGGSGGGGVLLVKKPDASWSEPAFYYLGGVSFGLQFGAKESQLLMLIMTDGGLEKLMKHSVKLGGDLSIAAGQIGIEEGAATTANLGADILVYAFSSGLFGGIAAEGSIVQSRDDWNEIYYQKAVFPKQIVFDHAVSNAGSQALRHSLGAGSGKKSGNDKSDSLPPLVIPAPVP